MTITDATAEEIQLSTIDLARSYTFRKLSGLQLRLSISHSGISKLVAEPGGMESGEPVFTMRCPRCKLDIGFVPKLELFDPDSKGLQADDIDPLMGFAYPFHPEPLCVDADRIEENFQEHFFPFSMSGLESEGVDFARVQLERAMSGGVKWLIPNVMEEGKLASLFGPPKAGKSLLALEWALAAARERRVVYLDEENDPREVLARMEDMEVDLGSLDKFTYHSFKGWTVDTDSGAASIIDVCRSADLVVFDSWAKFFAGASQSDDAAANRAYNLTIKPLRKEGVGILRLDHSGHGEVTRPAGSIQKLADVDHNWQIKAKPLSGGRASVTLVHRDNRTNRGPDTINLVREVGPLRHTESGQGVSPEGEETVVADSVAELVSLMDEKGWPVDWSVRKCAEELRKIGQAAGQSVIADAVRLRKHS